MRVVALTSFVARVAGDSRTVARGAEFDLPDGVDWLRAGLVAPVGSTSSPTGAHMHGVERAVDANVAGAERRAMAMATDWGEALVTEIDGIGPVTARRLAEAGIETMAELLAADPAHVALIASVKPVQVEKWRQRAQAVAGG